MQIPGDPGPFSGWDESIQGAEEGPERAGPSTLAFSRPCGISGRPLLLGLCLSCQKCPDVPKGKVLPAGHWADIKRLGGEHG